MDKNDADFHRMICNLDKDTLREMLIDMSVSFTENELTVILQNEFFNDVNPMDADLVDAVVVRRLRMRGIVLDDEAVQQERKRMITEVFRQIFTDDD